MPLIVPYAPYRKSIATLGISSAEDARIQREIGRNPTNGTYFLQIFSDSHKPTVGYYWSPHRIVRAEESFVVHVMHLNLGAEIPIHLIDACSPEELAESWVLPAEQQSLRLLAQAFLAASA